jgi:DNA-binding NarL/FixJ family response regulator
MRTIMTVPISTAAAALSSSTRVVIGVLNVRRTSRLPSGARVTVPSATARQGRFVRPLDEVGRRATTDCMAPTLLIVDDHAAFRSTARALLECDGWNVIGEAGDGTSGLSAARDLKPDVVLLDVRLPDIAGFAVAERLTAEQIVAKLPEQPQTVLARIATYEQAKDKRATVLQRIAALTGPEPAPGYDALTADEAQKLVTNGSATLAAAVRDYERRHKDRASVIETAVRHADADADTDAS